MTDLQELRIRALQRYGNRCMLYLRLPEELKEALEEYASFLFDTIDMAHILGRGAYPHLRLDLDNVVMLNRYSHTMLDQYRHPITGKMQNKKTTLEWWKYIIGNEQFYRLMEKSNGR